MKYACPWWPFWIYTNLLLLYDMCVHLASRLFWWLHQMSSVFILLILFPLYNSSYFFVIYLRNCYNIHTMHSSNWMDILILSTTQEIKNRDWIWEHLDDLSFLLNSVLSIHAIHLIVWFLILRYGEHRSSRIIVSFYSVFKICLIEHIL